MEFNYITSTGIALDDFGNEVRDESGAVVIVPEDERHFYDIAYRPHEEPEEWEDPTDYVGMGWVDSRGRP